VSTSDAPVPIAVAGLVRDGRVLLGHRHPARSAYPDCWDLVGGHVEPGESPYQAIQRECREELGIRVHNAQPMSYTNADPALDIRAFVVTDWDGEPVNAAPEELDDVRWFDPSELGSLTMAFPAVLSDIVNTVRGSAF
jgi:8-oxo-dGTP pyrophosphatase MutT (NUDIX family)